MDSIVSNASPLIYLAKANQLSILMLLVDQVLIPEAVYKEVVLEGKQHGQKDAFLVEKAIQDGRKQYGQFSANIPSRWLYILAKLKSFL